MFYQQNGITKSNVSQQAQMFVNSHTMQLNQIFGCVHNGYLVVD
jgi:hypothetical protein